MGTPFNTARAYMEAGNLPAARKIAGEAMEKTPDDVAVHDLLVDIEFAAKDYEKVLRLCREALERWPDHSGLRFSHALTLIYTRRGGEALRAVETFEEEFAFRPMDALLLNTIYQVTFGSLKRARYYRGKIAELSPDSSHLSMLDMMIANKADDMLGRERASKRMAEDAPMNAAAHARLAEAQFAAFRLASARRSARAALLAEPTKRRPEGTIWLTWIVLFPPFFLSHLLDWMNGMRISLLPRGIAGVLKLPMELTAFALFYFLVYRPLIYPWAPTGTGFALVFFYILWIFLPDLILRWAARRSDGSKDVKLDGY